VAYLDEREGTLFAGDSMGIVLAADAPSHPPTPPPSVDLKAWERTLEEISVVAPERFGATHFGLHGDVADRVRQLRERLAAVEARVRQALARDDLEDAACYEREVREELGASVGREDVERYFDMFAAATDWAGVRFYVERNP
jgi:glyoxylase-like metal-dependent hydrolase (beta-lactamase superfamily II)